MQMMFKHAKFMMGHVDEVNMQVLVLPYAEEELCMVVLLPDENTDLAVVSPGHRVSVHCQLSSFSKSVSRLRLQSFQLRVILGRAG